MGRLLGAVLVTALALMAGLISRGQGSTQQLLPRLQAVADRATSVAFLDQRELSHVPGLAITVVTPSKGASDAVGGIGDLRSGARVRRGQVQPVGSVTKPFIAVLTMRLVENGKLQLSEGVLQIAERYGGPGAALTRLATRYRARLDGVDLRELLSHTSGLFDFSESDRFAQAVLKRPLAHRSLRVLARWGLQHKPYFRPGAPGKWQYSSTNTVLEAMILEAVTKRSIAEQVNSLIKGIGLKHTYYDPTPSELRRPPIGRLLLHGYQPALAGDPNRKFYSSIARPRKAQLILRPPVTQVTAGLPRTGRATETSRLKRAQRFRYFDVTDGYSLSLAGPAGSLVSNPRDLAKFWTAFLGGRLVHPATIEAMEQTVPTGKNAGYGLGLTELTMPAGSLWDGSPKVKLFGHGGAIFGYNTGSFYVEDHGIIFSQTLNVLPTQNINEHIFSNVLRVALRRELRERGGHSNARVR
jgi:D-alanyl-D-alanine carboxypeptidase